MSTNFTLPSGRRTPYLLGLLCGLLLAVCAGWISQHLGPIAGPERAFCGLSALPENGPTFRYGSKDAGQSITFSVEDGFLKASDKTAYRMIQGEVCFIAEDK